MEEKRRSNIESRDKAVALYHLVYADEGFEESAQALFRLVQRAQRVQPGKERKLFLDIEGHRDDEGAFDSDMLELQEHFLLGVLARYLSEIHCPLVTARNPNPQDDEIPPLLAIQDREIEGSAGSHNK